MDSTRLLRKVMQWSILFRRDTFASAEGTEVPSTTLTGSIHTSKNKGCLRMQPTGFNTLNHDAKVIHI